MDNDSTNLPEISSAPIDTVVPLLREGYSEVNPVGYVCASEEELIVYLTNEIAFHFENHQFKILEIKKEFRPTNYLKNPRPLRTFIVEDSSNRQHVFVFDVAGSINFL